MPLQPPGADSFTTEIVWSNPQWLLLSALWCQRRHCEFADGVVNRTQEKHIKVSYRCFAELSSFHVPTTALINEIAGKQTRNFHGGSGGNNSG